MTDMAALRCIGGNTSVSRSPRGNHKGISFELVRRRQRAITCAFQIVVRMDVPPCGNIAVISKRTPVPVGELGSQVKTAVPMRFKILGPTVVALYVIPDVIRAIAPDRVIAVGSRLNMSIIAYPVGVAIATVSGQHWLHAADPPPATRARSLRQPCGVSPRFRGRGASTRANSSYEGRVMHRGFGPAPPTTGLGCGLGNQWSNHGRSGEHQR